MVEPKSCDGLRSRFAAAMSQMYRKEVPAYGQLIDLVAKINTAELAKDPALKRSLELGGGLARISDERHGAIRLGTAAELALVARFFKVLGMHPVGYYDLATSGIPVHSTAFRPIDASSLQTNPFRVFTSVLRTELISDVKVRSEANAILGSRSIFNSTALELLEAAEKDGLTAGQADEFVEALLETFKWHDTAAVTPQSYSQLNDEHRLVADIVSFKGPHINHLTPRTLNIDLAHLEMSASGIEPKATIEGPPKRQCPILLRQTSFLALNETVNFVDHDGQKVSGTHTARFGEIEERGAALTPEGHSLYEKCMAASAELQKDGATDVEAKQAAFELFPDDWEQMQAEALAYFKSVDSELTPVVYEDFLPVSAAGIFRSNLGEGAPPKSLTPTTRANFEAKLGMQVLSPFDLYRASAQ